MFHLHVIDIHYILKTFGYTGIFLTVFFDSGVLLPIPGDILLFTAGVFCLKLGFNIFALICIGFVATILGVMTGYYIGVHVIKLQKYSFFKKYLKQENIDKAHAFFDRYGARAIVFSRFFPIVRTYVPVIAGAARMNYASFIKYNLIVSALWSSVLVLLGFFLGHVFPHGKSYIFTILSLIVALSVLLPIAVEQRRGRQMRR